MTAVVLATACAVVYGTADFFGGLATKRSPVLAVVAISQVAGLIAFLPLLPLLPGSLTGQALVWGALSGAAGATGIVIFYWTLANGTMSVVAPTTAVVSSAIPVIFGLAMGERPQALALTGVGIAILAVSLVSWNSGPSTAASAGRGRWIPVLGALAAGAGFGSFFVLLDQVPSGTGLWPLLGARFSSITLVVALALAAGKPLNPGPGSLRVIASAGVLDMAANVFFLLATQQGMLSLVAVLASLYPASTLLLARYVLRERLNLVQVVGVGLAGGAVALIAAAT